ncbi:circularly permuted type 2 ATP-grasp protein [Mariprofundus ferrooxydans]|uniref:circularly permuted type 2 ATP-grasp protein n=1 Tax=Mariprofundus ferrooxydans TaxID=314344 RepID=UPI0003770916|nr:circularly permuted type 2 ATP-grasp protein [Mariprofundus ferrooxydans]
MFNTSDAAPFDEAFDSAGHVRPEYAAACNYLTGLGVEGIEQMHQSADLALLNQGVTFTVYSDARGTEKIFPFDLMPRLITAAEWDHIERGIVQRVAAMNLFLEDIYHEQKILRSGLIPPSQILGSPLYCREMTGLNPIGGVHVHIAGVDLIRNQNGEFMVLEDNLRCPSGVSYVLENRMVSNRIMPDLLGSYRVRPVSQYPQMLYEAMASFSRSSVPKIAVLTPGVYNSAYFEHTFLASQMGAELVEGADLLVNNDILYMKTTRGLQRIDVLYLRLDTEFIDPLAFRPDSLLGVPGLMHAYRAGNVTLANAPGNAVADDKSLYAYTPDIIRYYLDEEPLLPIVPTYLGSRPADLNYMLEHLTELVVKPTDASGGYGLMVGSHASKAEIAECREKLKAAPAHYVAQPIQQFSTHPSFVEQEGKKAFCSRHIDLRPFAVCGADGEVKVLSGGLTRVALKRGSLVVNSSQGGGSKDTWVLYPDSTGASRA